MIFHVQVNIFLDKINNMLIIVNSKQQQQQQQQTDINKSAQSNMGRRPRRGGVAHGAGWGQDA